MNDTLFFKLILVLILAKSFVEWLLEFLNNRHIYNYQGAMPSIFGSFINENDFEKSLQYTLVKGRFNQVQLVFSTCILIGIFAFNFLPFSYQYFNTIFGSSFLGQALCILAPLTLLGWLELPFEWWSQFKIEAAFEFNRSNLQLWLTDKLKGFLISLVLSVPMLALLLKFFHLYPNTWWLWISMALSGFQLLLLIVYPKFILPLFNQLTPLPEGGLKKQLLKLTDKCKFPATNLFVMDGSKRSTHSNAFFTGFGRFRNIILFDTLIQQLTHKELEAVLAHEIGHYKKGHVPKRLLLSCILLPVSLYLVDWLCHQNWFFEAFGFGKLGDLPQYSIMPCTLLLFMILTSIGSFWLSPLSNLWSRKHEYEADHYAAQLMGSPQFLISALQKLCKKNLTNLVPHPFYSFFQYSHPTLLEREAKLLSDHSTLQL